MKIILVIGILAAFNLWLFMRSYRKHQQREQERKAFYKKLYGSIK